MKSLYEELGVDSKASQEEIKSAYRSAARRTHPDQKGGDAESFKMIRAAYDVLGDPERRERYDKTGRTETTSKDDQAEIELMSMVGAAMVQDKPIRWMAQQIEGERSAARAQCEQIESAIKKITKNIEKLESRTVDSNEKGKSMILEAARSNVQTAEQDLEHAKAKVEKADRKIKMLNGLLEDDDFDSIAANWTYANAGWGRTNW